MDQIARVEVREASVSRLPFSDGAFDVSTAVETHIWWPALTADLFTNSRPSRLPHHSASCALLTNFGPCDLTHTLLNGVFLDKVAHLVFRGPDVVELLGVLQSVLTSYFGVT
jgi:hypothetical protein